MTFRRLLVVSPLLLLLAACTNFKASSSIERVTEHVVDAPIDVETRNGRIEVIADPSVDIVTVKAMITCTGGTQSEAQSRADSVTLRVERNTSGLLTIRPVFPGGAKSGDAANLDIILPAVNGATLATSNGRIVARALAGAFDADTSNGAITVEHHAGPVDVRTSNGRITITDAAGEVRARTSNGAIDIDLHDTAPGPVDCTTSNGRIALHVGADFAGRVRMSTSNGSLKLEDPHGHARSHAIGKSEGTIEFGDGPESMLSTSNGSIRVVVDAPAE